MGSPDRPQEMPRNVGLARRFGAIVYDLLLVIALMMVVTLLFVAAREGMYVAPGDTLYRIALVAIAYVFFVGFWTYKGRTLGMQSWGLQLECMDGAKVGICLSTIRFSAAIISWLPAGLGYGWQIWDKENLTWHDRLSQTRIRYYPRR